ncbi:MAG: nucleoside-triphosphatase [Oscillospiraceae bacterium]|nr:nucleoside-triphosphatase [Oscillospiraceae bacterium]
MHVFLTGEKQVGKTTVITSFLEKSGLTADGFMTYWEQSMPGERRLYLAPFSPKKANVERRLIATDFGHGLSPIPEVTEVFDTYGKSLLDNSGNCGYIVMDEIGFIEANAKKFLASVMAGIDGEIPIIGVLKKCDAQFIQEIRSHKNVILKDVTAENREEILNWLLKKI